MLLLYIFRMIIVIKLHTFTKSRYHTFYRDPRSSGIILLSLPYPLTSFCILHFLVIIPRKLKIVSRVLVICVPCCEL